MPALNFEGQISTNRGFRGQDLNGSSFFKATLDSVRFNPSTTGIVTQLRGTNFSEALLTNVNMSQAVFAPNTAFSQSATFVSATLLDVNFKGADLRRADFTLANGIGVTMANANLTEAILVNANFGGEAVVAGSFQNANLTRADLTGANLKSVDLTGAKLISAKLEGAMLESILMSNVDATGADFRMTNFTDAVVQNSIFDLANLGGVALTDTTPTDTSGGVFNRFRGANLEDFRSEDIVLGSADFRPYDPGLPGTGQTNSRVRVWTLDALPAGTNRNTDIVITNLSAAILPDTNLSESKFNGANLSSFRAEDLNLNGSDFSAYKTSNGRFILTNLSNAVLSDNPLNPEEAEITGAKFNSAVMNGFSGDDVNFTNADFSPYVDPATNAFITRAIDAATGLNAPNPTNTPIRTQLNGANLMDSTLVGANLTLVQADTLSVAGADLTNAIARGADMSTANLGFAILTGADFSPWVSPTSATPRIRVQLDGAFMENATITGANFTEANLSGANLKFATGDGTTLLVSANLAGADLTSATLLETQLDNAVMTGATLSFGEFNGADLRGARLDGGASLSNASFTSAILTNANLSGAFAEKVSLDGANLTGANLSGINLKDATAVRANFTNANVTNADFTSVDLTNANFTGARATGAIGLYVGGTGNDTLTGSVANESFFGNQGNDRINAGGGVDYLDGGAGDDILNGGDGNDRFNGRAGNDRMDGGFGDDTYFFNGNAFGNDTILNFRTGADTIDLSSYRALTFSSLTIQVVGANSVIRSAAFGTGSSITVNGVTGLTEADFEFFAPPVV